MIRTFAIFFLFIAAQLPAQHSADVRWLRNINQPANPGLDRAAKFTSQTVAPLALGVPAGILIYNLATKAKGKQQLVPLVIDGAVLTSATLCLGLKYGIDRPRPFVTYPDIEQRMHVGPHSFPSAHTGNAFALATSLSICYPKWYVAAPSYAWACAVGYSRMRLGVHYPSDVLCGAIIGTGCAFLSWKLSNYLVEKRNEKKDYHTPPIVWSE